MQGRRVAVTGLGIVSPVGNTLQEAWKCLSTGQTGIAGITHFDAASFACQIAGEVKGFTDAEKFNPRHSRRVDIFIRYAIKAASDALADAKLQEGSFDSLRAGVLIGSGIGGLPMIEHQHNILVNEGQRRVSPFFIPGAIINMAAGWVSMLYGLHGPNLAISTACTTGTHCIGEGARKIAYGDADIIVAGGTESAVTPLAIAGFSSARALSFRNDEPHRASRPFDRERDGFVLGEGSGILVLEEFENAKARGADIYCELVGYGQSGDAHHITAPPEDGAGARMAMMAAVADSGLGLGDFDHVNAHGTSTPLGDIAETTAVKEVFKNHARNLAISGTKSMTGHLLGAAGGIEAVFAAMSIKHGQVPPTINLDNPDSACDLDYVGGTSSREMNVKAALSNSFGFGGTNATLAFAQN